MQPMRRRDVVVFLFTAAPLVAAGCIAPRRSSDDSGDGDSGDTGDTGPDTADTGTADTGTTDTGPDTAETCAETPPNIEGPYYLAGVPVRTELDLYGDKGARLTLSGTVRSAGCEPIAAAVVEIWQADPTGAYDNHSAEMRYRGQTATDANGAYSFHTVVPGIYPVGDTYRPKHIHVKVWVKGVERLCTQLYFLNDPYLKVDDNDLPALILPLDGLTDGTATFDFVLADP